MAKAPDSLAGQPVIRLYDYQRRFVADPARVLVALWARQTGKDFATAVLAVDDALRSGRPWYIVSLTQRQADETFAKCRRVAEALKRAAKLAGPLRAEDGPEYADRDDGIDQAFRCRARTLHLPGGGSVTSLPGRSPDTLAGLTGNVIFTEFGLFPNGGYDHWRVVFPLATRGFRVVVISTPRGRNSKLFELVSAPETYSVHRVDVHQAVADGMPLVGADGRPCSIEDLRRLYGDEAGWRREYLLEFSGDLEALVTWARLVAAADAEPIVLLEIAGEAGWRADAWRALAGLGGRVEIGWDVARHRNLSVVWANAAAPGGQKRLAGLALMRDASFALQREAIGSLLDLRPEAVGCGDATGLGMDSNETLATRYPGRWEGVNFTARVKSELGSLLRTSYGDGEQRVPPTDGPLKYIATDIYALQAEGDGKQLKLAETDNPLLPESHCDLAYANALALRAGAIPWARPHLSVA